MKSNLFAKETRVNNCGWLYPLGQTCGCSPKVESKIIEGILLHAGHVGVCCMKALARSHIWWPGLDDDIETLSSQCEACKTMAAMPAPAAHHPWQYSTVPWERVHIDVGEWNKTNLPVLVDAFSKWAEVKLISSTTTQKTIGFPAILVSDNKPQITSSEFEDYLQGNNITYYKSPPYHPASNGLAENMVKYVKYHLKKEAPTTKTDIKIVSLPF